MSEGVHALTGTTRRMLVAAEDRILAAQRAERLKQQRAQEAVRCVTTCSVTAFIHVLVHCFCLCVCRRAVAAVEAVQRAAVADADAGAAVPSRPTRSRATHRPCLSKFFFFCFGVVLSSGVHSHLLPPQLDQRRCDPCRLEAAAARLPVDDARRAQLVPRRCTRRA